MTTERDLASKLATRRVREIPQDLEVATLEDFDDLESDYTIVPILGRTKIQNWVTRGLTAGERRIIEKTAFPKASENMTSIAEKGKKRRRGEVDLTDEDMVRFMEMAHEQACLTIKTCTVYPENVTLEHIRKLPAADFDRLLESIESDDEQDKVSRFLEQTGQSTNGEG